MINIQQIHTDLDQNTTRLLDALSAFSAADFSRKPSPTGWSAAEIADHVLQVMMFGNKALKGNALPTERPFDEKIKVIIGAMSNMNANYQSPEMAMPRKGDIDQAEITEILKGQRFVMKESLDGSDLSYFCSDFKHPGFGGLTKFEWIYFDIHHVARHISQMKRLK